MGLIDFSGTLEKFKRDLPGIVAKALRRTLETPQRARSIRSVSDLTDEDLLRRAVRGARGNYRRGHRHPRWVAVMHTFSLGSTFAHELCQRFGFDPDECGCDDDRKLLRSGVIFAGDKSGRIAVANLSDPIWGDHVAIEFMMDGSQFWHRQFLSATKARLLAQRLLQCADAQTPTPQPTGEPTLTAALKHLKVGRYASPPQPTGDQEFLGRCTQCLDNAYTGTECREINHEDCAVGKWQRSTTTPFERPTSPPLPSISATSIGQDELVERQVAIFHDDGALSLVEIGASPIVVPDEDGPRPVGERVLLDHIDELRDALTAAEAENESLRGALTFADEWAQGLPGQEHPGARDDVRAFRSAIAATLTSGGVVNQQTNQFDRNYAHANATAGDSKDLARRLSDTADRLDREISRTKQDIEDGVFGEIELMRDATAELDRLTNRVVELEKVLEPITAACEIDFTGPVTEEGDDPCPDGESIGGGKDGTMALTFGMIRNARRQLNEAGSI